MSGVADEEAVLPAQLPPDLIPGGGIKGEAVQLDAVEQEDSPLPEGLFSEKPFPGGPAAAHKMRGVPQNQAAHGLLIGVLDRTPLLRAADAVGMGNPDGNAAALRRPQHQAGIEHGVAVDHVVAVFPDQPLQLRVKLSIALAGGGQVPDLAALLPQLRLVSPHGIAKDQIIHPELLRIGIVTDVPAHQLRAADIEFSGDNQHFFHGVLPVYFFFQI